MLAYRSEIDGLRAVAVVPVVLYHAGFSVFSGGFVGVDVFFVISGYLITAIIAKELADGGFTLLGFYERRVRRLAPALLTVLIASTACAYFIMIPAHFEDYLSSLIATATFTSNFYFFKESGYFATAAELLPLLHTWSLAIEEQFYILFPLLMIFLHRFAWRVTLLVLSALLLASLGAAHWASLHHPDAAFYLPPTRIWELLIGAIAALWTRRAPISLSQRSNDLLSLSGLVMIAIAVFAYDNGTPFPSLYALLPTGGAILVILFARPGTIAHMLLSAPLCVGIGLISYSFYLWHQPVFVFGRLIELGELSLGLRIGLVAASLALAYVSWRFVERPFRTGPRSRRFSRASLFGGAGALSAVIIVFGLVADNDSYFRHGLPETKQRHLDYIGYNKTQAFADANRKPDCFFGSSHNSFEYFKPERCLTGSSDKPNVLIMGDSHAAHLWIAFEEAFPDLNILQATASGCRPLAPFEGAQRCTDLLRYLWREFLPQGGVDTIVLSGRWRADDLRRLSGTIAELNRMARRVVVIGPTVEYAADLPVLLSKFDSGAKRLPMGRYLIRERFELSAAMKPIATTAGAIYVDIAAAICADDQCAVVSKKGEPMVWDGRHYTPSGARDVVETLIKTDALPLLIETR